MHTFRHISPAVRLRVRCVWLFCLCPVLPGMAAVHSLPIYTRPIPVTCAFLQVCEPLSLRFAAPVPPPRPRPVRSDADGENTQKSAAPGPASATAVPVPSEASSTETPEPKEPKTPPSPAASGAIAGPPASPPPPAEPPIPGIIPDDTPRQIRAEDLLPYFQLPTGSPPPSSATYQQR